MKYVLFALLSGSLLWLGSCRKENKIAANGVNLRFSTDTVFLDTVFTGVNSSTYILKVYNPADENVVIDRIYLEKGNGSPYRLNINGSPSRDQQNTEILAGDSIYIFVEVTAPLGGGQDFLLTDRILFSNKSVNQDVDLVTTANDAYFHFPRRFVLFGDPPNQVVVPYSIITCNETWRNDKPHVIYGYAVVDSACKLTIEAGSQIYFHQNSGLWVFDEGELAVAVNTNPGLEDSVVFSGDRLEPFYENSPGQWGGLLGGIFIDGKARAEINNTLIKNAVNAIRVDSAHYSDQLKLYNTYILNTSRTAIFGGFGAIDARNVVVANAGLYAFYVFGGNYEFRHCTFANYWNLSTRTTPAVLLSNYFDFIDENNLPRRIYRPLQNAYFGNCIIYGSNSQELELASESVEIFNYNFSHPLLKLHSDPEDRGFDINGSGFQDPLVNQDPDFFDPSLNKYDLDTNSQAINQGNNFDATGVILDLDILGRLRNGDGQPDLGAFENPKN